MTPEQETKDQTLVTKAEGAGARLTVKLSLAPKIGVQSLKERYRTGKYDLSNGYHYPDSLKSLVPTNVPDFIDQGENYVEKVTRALYYFKQCALIGPSGVGKSVCEGEPVFVLLNGKPTLTSMGDLYELLGRRLPTTVDEDGWETLTLPGADLKVLSMDRASGRVSWTRPYAMARSRFQGDIVEVTTRRNRVIRATPGHSFILEGSDVKASKISVGSSVPILRHIPSPGLAPLTEIALTDYVPAAKLTERGLVLGGRAAIQIPAPPAVSLDEELAWFLGFFVAEGYVGEGFASIYSSDSDLIERATLKMASLGLGTSVRVQRGLKELRIFSNAFVAMLSAATVSRRLGTGKGSQARYKKVPGFIFSAPDEVKAAFLRGFFEGDGWMERTGIALGTSSKELADGLVILCEQLGIFPAVRVRGKSAKRYSVAVARDGALAIGVDVADAPKGSGRRGHIEKVRITPEMIAAAKEAYERLPADLKSKRLRKRTVSCLCSGTSMIGLNTLARIAKEVNSEELREVAETNLLWDTVKRVERVPYDGWVYDFQVPGNETFVAGFGGVVTHNTHIVYMVAKMAGLPLWEINCGLQTSVYDLFGKFVGLGRENWIDGLIVSWCRHGGILYLDEANMMKQDIATRLNPILDTRGHMVLTEKDNEVIPRHQNGYVIISMNPYSAEFAGTKPLNAAFRRRMSVWVDFDYLSVGPKISQQEVKMIADRANIPVNVSERMVRVAAEMRKRYKNGDLPYAPSVGDLANWGTLIADGLTPTNAAEETIVSVTSDDSEVQGTVRRVVQMIFGGGAGPERPA
ncbi:MAG: CbbQ/NirQ/NorQ C-terminal domain-containing protein [Nitrososphaerota archaeon]|nr:CbbQ/NirQ/NorQ C-terminal domain-containing protein [Nitrososphaerota archaeon]MDG7023187.1 CbbQ/NirQ/NorQ C-terminal domain-containing protein [Nitrososphaerota archaeon]